MSSEDVAVRVVVRPYATSLPLGCFAFGIGNVVFAAFTAHWLPPSDARALATLLLAFVAPLELIPSFVAFVARDTGAATALAIFGGSWIVLGLQLLDAGGAATSPTIGLFLCMLALCLGLLAIASISAKPLFAVLFCVAMLRSAAAGLVQFDVGGAASAATVGFGLALAALAFYCGFGLLMEDVLQEPLRMMFRSGKARQAMLAGAREQLANVAREPGVRQQL